MEGWARFHRQIFEWEWYTDPNTFRLFFHLVLMVNHTDNYWRGQLIKRGQKVTSYNKLSNQLDLSVQQIRTSIKKLESTHEITRTSTNKNTLITVVNYDIYQSEKKNSNKQSNKQSNNQITNEQQTNNNQITTNKNDKNDKNDNKKPKKKKDSLVSTKYTKEYEELYSIYPKNDGKSRGFKNYTTRLKEFTHEQLLNCVKAYKDNVKTKDKQYIKTISNFFGQDATFEDYINIKPKVKIDFSNDIIYEEVTYR